MTIPRLLIDRIGNTHERKNVYLRELAELEERLAQAEGEEKNRLLEAKKKHIAEKDKHPYHIALQAYK